MIGLDFLQKQVRDAERARDHGLGLHRELMAELDGIDRRLLPAHQQATAAELRGKKAAAFSDYLRRERVYERIAAALAHERDWAPRAYLSRARFTAPSAPSSDDSSRLLTNLYESFEAHRQQFAASRMSLDALRVAWFDGEVARRLAQMAVLMREAEFRSANGDPHAESLAREMAARLAQLDLPELTEAREAFAALRDIETDLRAIKEALEHGSREVVDAIERAQRIIELRGSGTELSSRTVVMSGDPIGLLHPVASA